MTTKTTEYDWKPGNQTERQDICFDCMLGGGHECGQGAFPHNILSRQTLHFLQSGDYFIHQLTFASCHSFLYLCKGKYKIKQ